VDYILKIHQDFIGGGGGSEWEVCMKCTANIHCVSQIKYDAKKVWQVSINQKHDL